MKYLSFLIFFFSAFIIYAQTNIEKYEYWFDNNYGNKISTDINIPSAGFNFNENISTAGLTEGLHLFHIRFKDSNGNWSSVNSNFFQKSPNINNPEPSICKIINYEYWIDDDLGNKITETSSGNTTFNLATNFDFSNIETGLHLLHIRFKDDCGQWSSVCSSFFQKLPEPNTVEPDSCKITGYEYWIDDDLGNKITEPSSGTTTLNLATNFDFSNIETGLHLLHIRFKDDCGQWSSVCSSFFQKLPEPNTVEPDSCKITGYEYWIDDKYNNKTFMDVAPPEGVFSLVGDLGLSGLTLGQHTFHIRFKDDCGQWSSVCSDFFEAPSCTPDTSIVYIDTCDIQLVSDVCDTEIFTGQNGCDSVVLTCYQWLPVDTLPVDQFTCDPALDGITVNEPYEVSPNCWGLKITTFHLPPSNTPPTPIGDQLICLNETSSYFFEDADSLTNNSYLWLLETADNDTTFITDTSILEQEWNQVNNYLLSVSAINGCGDTSEFSVPLPIEIPTPPIASIIESNCELMAEQSTGLTYTWILDSIIIPNANQPNYTPMENGIYHLIVTDANGCSATDSISVNCFVNNNEAAWLKGFNLFPNPNNGDFFIEINTLIYSEEIHFEIYNSLGKKIFFEKELFKGNHFSKKINMTNKASGIYFLKIEIDGNTVFRKFILENN